MSTEYSTPEYQGHPDDYYCGFCGEEDTEQLHSEANLGIICDTCCNALLYDWTSHQVETYPDHLAYEDWLKLAQPTRIVKLDLTDAEIHYYTTMAAMCGVTLDEFINEAIHTYLESVRDSS